MNKIYFYVLLLSLLFAHSQAGRATANFIPDLTGVVKQADYTLQLEWVKRHDGIAKFKIYRDNSLIHTIEGAALKNHTTYVYNSSSWDKYSFIDTNFQSGVSYNYKVEHINGSGTILLTENTTVNIPVPDNPGSVTATLQPNQRIKVTWAKPQNNFKTIKHYFIFKNGNYYGEVNNNSFEFTDTNVKMGLTYTYEVQAVDYWEEGSSKVAKTVETPSVLAQNFSATLNPDLSVDITWQAPAGIDYLKEYELFRIVEVGSSTDEKSLGVVTKDKTSFDATVTDTLASYKFYLRSIDLRGKPYNTPHESASVPAVLPPSNLAIAFNADYSFSLSWDHIAATAYLAKYQIHRSEGGAFTQIAEVTGDSYKDETIQSGKTYTYKIRTINIYDDASGFSQTVESTTVAPSTPTDFTAKFVGDGVAELNWTPSAAAEKIQEYEVYRDKKLVGRSGIGKYYDRGLVENKAYYYSLRAKDEFGNPSGFTATKRVLTSLHSTVSLASEAILVNSETFITPVANAPSDFENGKKKSLATLVEVYHPHPRAKFLGMYRFTFEIKEGRVFDNPSVDVLIKRPEDSTFKKIFEVSLNNDHEGWNKITYFWNSRAAAHDWTATDAQAYQTNSDVQFKFYVH